MTERNDDLAPAEEHVEDLEAPAGQQQDVVGGRGPQCGETDCEFGTEGVG